MSERDQWCWEAKRLSALATHKTCPVSEGEREREDQLMWGALEAEETEGQLHCPPSPLPLAPLCPRPHPLSLPQPLFVSAVASRGINGLSVAGSSASTCSGLQGAAFVFVFLFSFSFFFSPFSLLFGVFFF